MNSKESTSFAFPSNMPKQRFAADLAQFPLKIIAKFLGTTVLKRA